MKHPSNIFSPEESEEFQRLADMVQESEAEAFLDWCRRNHLRLADAVAAWTTFEELMRRCCIDELMFYNTPGVFSLRTSQVQGLNGFDLEGIDDGEEWDGRTLYACIKRALEDILAIEEAEKDDV